MSRLFIALTLGALAAGCSNKLGGTDQEPTDTDDAAVTDPDEDEDGWVLSEDCDDADPLTHPEADELCDGADNDCDGVVPAEEGDLDDDGVVECDEFCGTQPPADTLSGTISDCTYTPSPTGTPFETTIEWSMGSEMTDPSTGQTVSAYTFADFPDFGAVWQSPMVGQTTDDDFDDDVDGDDVPDIAIIMTDDSLANVSTGPHDGYGGVLRLISGDGAKVHASTRWQSFTNEDGTFEYAPFRYAGLALAQLDADPPYEIVTTAYRRGTDPVSHSACFPAVYEVRQTNGLVTLVLDQVAEHLFAPCGAHAPAIADVDGDGGLDVVLGRNWYEGKDLAWKSPGGSDGRGWWGAAQYGGAGYWNSGFHSFPYDVDLDGTDMEVVAGNTVYEPDGSVWCHLGEPDGLGGYTDARDGYAAIADLDDDGTPEIVVTGNEHVSVFSTDVDVADGAIRTWRDQDFDPTTDESVAAPNARWCPLVAQAPNNPWQDAGFSLPAGYTHPYGCSASTDEQAFGGPPTVANFDPSDGTPEIATAGACWYQVYKLDGGELERFAMAPTKDWSSASTGSTVFSFNGNRDHIVFNDEEALYVWYVTDEDVPPWERLKEALVDDNHKSWTIHEYPLVADVDGDGKAEILVTNSYLPPDDEDKFGLYVLGAADDDWVSARTVWSQHAYYVTNANEDLSVGNNGYCEPNFPDYNSFRQQSPGTFGETAASNLFVEAEEPCQEGCGDITVYLQVGNEADFITAGTGVVVAIYGVDASGRTLLDSRNLSVPVQPGTLTAGIGFQVSGWESYDHLVAVVDDPDLGGGTGGWGAARECDEGDNEVVIPLDDLCP